MAIQAAATMELTGIPKEAFTSWFQDLHKRWQQCIDCGGNYSGTSIYRFLQRSFSRKYRSPFLVPNEVPYKQRYLFPHPSFPDLSFYHTDRL
jgi:hypothetical protein